MKIKTPNTYLFILLLTVFIAALTWIVPAGTFSDPEHPSLENYQPVPSSPQGIKAIVSAPVRGMVNAAEIIVFVLIVGGAFGVFRKTEALDSAIKTITRLNYKHPKLEYVILPLLITLFSLGGAIFGMSEEVIPFILIFIPLSYSLGFDEYVGVAIPYVGAHTGFAAAFLNPFTVGIAQKFSGLPLFSGVGYRIFVWIIFTVIAILFIMLYARRKKREKNRENTIPENRTDSLSDFRLDSRHKLVLGLFALAIAILIFGVLRYGWYIEEIAAFFLVTGIIIGIAGKLKTDEITGSFVSGARDLVGTALIIGLARGVLLVAKDGQIIDTILFYLSGSIRHLHPVVSAQAMFIIQTVINFFVPSGTGQAALTMPIMAPLSDLLGVSRQTAVLAFQFGDGFSNMIIPTSPVLMGVLALAKISYGKWFKWIIKLEIIFLAAGLLLLIPPFFLGW